MCMDLIEHKKVFRLKKTPGNMCMALIEHHKRVSP